MTWQQHLAVTVWAAAAQQSDASKQQAADEDAAVALSKAVVAAFYLTATGGSFKGGTAKRAAATKTIASGAVFDLDLVLETPVTDQTLDVVNPVTPVNTANFTPPT